MASTETSAGISAFVRERRRLSAAAACSVLALTAVSAGTAGGAVAVAEPTSPEFTTPANQELLGVDARSADDVWAVGYSCPGDCLVTLDNRTWVQHYDGHTWRHVPSFTDPGQSEELSAVKEITPRDVWAVGSHVSVNGGTVNCLAEHWNGRRWSRVPMRGGPLHDVDGLGSDDVWAVGNNKIHHWDGSSWHNTPFQAAPSSWISEFDSVTELAPDDVWAVGSFSGHDYVEHPLTEHWDGRRWSYVASLSPPRYSGFQSVSGSGSDDVWAVGLQDYDQPMAAHWDGSTWTEVQTPVEGLQDPELAGVVSLAPDDAWAVGHADTDTAVVPLIEHWDGDTWSVVQSAGSRHLEYLADVSAASASDAWAVGTKGPSLHNKHALREHYDGSGWTGA